MHYEEKYFPTLETNPTYPAPYAEQSCNGMSADQHDATQYDASEQYNVNNATSS